MLRDIRPGDAVVTVQTNGCGRNVSLVACSTKEKDGYRFVRYETSPASAGTIESAGGIYHRGVFGILKKNSWRCETEEELNLQYRSMFDCGVVVIITEEELLKQRDGTYLVMKNEREAKQ